jgi:hypothetical protein
MALLAAALASPVMIAGCAARVSTGYRVYDPYYTGYRTWDNGETVYYQQWEADTHRTHRDYRKRKPDEQKQYWNWRHDHAHDYNHH